MSRFDISKVIVYLMLLDANNLYGWAMSQYLPTHDFEWLTNPVINRLDIRNKPEDNDIGYIYEVDLRYNQHLHKLHNDYPLAPESLTVTEDMLFPLQQQRYPPNIKSPHRSSVPICTPNAITSYIIVICNFISKMEWKSLKSIKCSHLSNIQGSKPI